MTDRPPLPPFTAETAAQKVQAAEDAWNTRDPHRVSLAYSEGSVWRNRDTFINGRDEIVTFLTAKWDRELEYALRKNLWCFDQNRIAVRFNTNVTIGRGIGGEATATSCGSSTSTGSWFVARPASTTPRSRRLIAGFMDPVPPTTRAERSRCSERRLQQTASRGDELGRMANYDDVPIP